MWSVREPSLIAFASSPLDQGVWLELSWVVFAVERGTNSRVGIVGACGFGRRDLSSLDTVSIRRVVWKEIMYCTIVDFARKQHWDEVPLDVFAVGALTGIVMWAVKSVFGVTG